jgi:ubiquinone/menaquinone biosynthesis C-methylase UbiE
MGKSPKPMEQFLESFHRENPGCTPASFSNGYTDDGFTSYDKLIQLIPASVPAKARLLDLACGDGFLLQKLKSLFPQLLLFGIDMSAGELEVARKRLNSTDVNFIEGNARALPFPSSSFDFILCHMAFMLMEDLDQVVSEIRRCLRSGGAFTAIVGGKFNHDPVFKGYLELLDEALSSEGKTWLKDMGDPRTRSVEALKELFTVGFDQVDVVDFEIRFYDRPEALINFFMLMYEVGLLSAYRKEKLRYDLLKKLEKACDVDGRISHKFALRQLQCRKI